MLYLLTSHTSGRLASPLKRFARYLFPGGGYQLVSRLPKSITRLDVIVGFTNPASNGLRKLKLDHQTIREASKFNLRHRLKAPGPVDDLRGTFWRSPIGPKPFCCVTWHPKAGLYAYRTLTARWLQIAMEMSKKPISKAQDMMVHKWRGEIAPPIRERLFRSKVVAYDTENDWDGERATKLTIFSIADEYGSAAWAWTPPRAKVIAEWMQTPGITKIAQNFVHDVPWLEKTCGVKMVGPLHDTMALRAEFCRQWPYGLQHIAAQFLVVDCWKTRHREGSLAEIKYAAFDSEATYLVAMEMFRLMPSLAEQGLPRY